MKIVKNNSINKFNENTQNIIVNFEGQKIYVGLDIHLNQWTVVIRCGNRTIKKMTTPPDPQIIFNYLQNNYPGASYYSAYEAGYFGFRPHEELIKFGINNIVINPADIPTTNKEKVNKTDNSDAGKIAMHLENGTLKGIYTPDNEQIGRRGLVRLRNTIIKEKRRVQLRIKGLLVNRGILVNKIPSYKYWCKTFIAYLENKVKFNNPYDHFTLQVYLKQLNQFKDHKKDVEQKLRDILKKEEHKKVIDRMKSLPGIGDTIAANLYLEIIDIKRFKKRDALAEYIGLAPMVRESADKKTVLGLTVRGKKYLRSLLIEAAWMAIDTGKYLLKFNDLVAKTSSKKKSIVRIAKMLLFDIRREWIIVLNS